MNDQTVTLPHLATGERHCAASSILLAKEDQRSYVNATLLRTHEQAVRANTGIDDDLLAQAIAVTGLTTTKATVEEAFCHLVRRHGRQAALADMAGFATSSR